MKHLDAIEDITLDLERCNKVIKENNYLEIIIAIEELQDKYKDKIKNIIYISPAFEYLRMKNRKLLIFPSIKQIIKIALDKENKERSSQVFRLTISSIREFCLLVK